MKNPSYIKTVLIALVLMLSMNLSAQDSGKREEDKPVRKVFNANQLVDLQTTVQPNAKSLELIIHHRFGSFENGISDLYGIYAPSNIRFGLNYGITDKLMVGVGTEKNNKLQDIHWKYTILEQTRSNRIPVSLSYYGNMALDARNKAVYGEGDVTVSTRMSYFHQIITSRKFSKSISVVAAAGYTHINKVDSIRQNDVLMLSLGGKFSITRKISVVAEYDHPVYVLEKKDYHELPKPNLGLAMEIATSTHIFQITLSQYRNIIPQYNALYNENALADGGLVLGFNINVKF